MSTGFCTACGGGGPTGPNSTTTAPVSTTTTTAPAAGAQVSQRYAGTLTPPPPQQPVPLDLSLFFNLPAGSANRGTIRPLAIYQVTGGYNTGPGGFTGSVTGSLDGTLDSGTFSGVLTANLPGGCVARRNYSGPLTRAALNWAPGAELETCGGTSPLAAAVNPVADSRPATSSTSTSTVASSSTTSSMTTTTLTPQSNLVITFVPFPSVPTIGFTGICSGGTTSNKSWLYTIHIENRKAVPFTIASWTTNTTFFNRTETATDFQLIFKTTTIGANATVQGSYCVWFTNAAPGASGTVFHTFQGTNGNGPFTSPTLTLAPTNMP